MTLSVGERHALAEIADRAAADDPGYARRLAGFGGYEVSPLGPPSKWTALPIAVVGVILLIGALVMPLGGKLDDNPPVNKSQGTVIQR